MKYLTPIVALLGAASAAPFGEIIAKRELTDLESRNACPKDLKAGQYDFPHYITQISKSSPDKPLGAQYFGKFTPNDVATVFSFDIPYSRKDATCALEFLFPKQAQLQTSSYSYKGAGTFYFKTYAPGSCPNDKTSWKNQPKDGGKQYGPLHMEPGYAYTISVGPCSAYAGTCAAGVMWSPDTDFNYFQDYNPCPIGLYTSYGYPDKHWKAME